VHIVFFQTEEGHYYLAARSMAELDVYIKEVYSEAVSTCEICQKLCLQVSFYVFVLDFRNCEYSK
jgi:hypothetical protein